MSPVIRAQCDPFLNKCELILGKPGFTVTALDNACEALLCSFNMARGFWGKVFKSTRGVRASLPALQTPPSFWGVKAAAWEHHSHSHSPADDPGHCWRVKCVSEGTCKWFQDARHWIGKRSIWHLHLGGVQTFRIKDIPVVQKWSDERTPGKSCSL